MKAADVASSMVSELGSDVDVNDDESMMIGRYSSQYIRRDKDTHNTCHGL